MRRYLVLSLTTLLACGPKAPPAPAAEPVPAPTPAPEAQPEPEAEPEPEPPAVTKPANNADLDVTMTWADGRSVSGKVVRIERSEDWYAEDGWTDRDLKLTVTLEGNGTEIESPWTDIQSVDVGYGTGRSDIDCTYDSSYLPWMYMCVLRTTPAVKTTDGKAWTANGRHMWRFTFEDGSAEEFYLYKLPARAQDDRSPEPGVEMPENAALYADLQSEVLQAAKASLKSIRISN